MLEALKMIWSHRRSLSEVTRAIDDSRRLIVEVVRIEFQTYRYARAKRYGEKS